MRRRCTAKNGAGKPCSMPPLRDSDRCLAHSRKAKAKATAARKKGGQRRGEQQRRAAAARAGELKDLEASLDSVVDVEAASERVFRQLLSGDLGAQEAAAAAKLLNILRDGAQRRERETLRRRARPVKSARVDGARALEEVVATFRQVVAEAKADRAMAPEARRDQIIRAGAVLIKAAEPARVIGELTDELRATMAPRRPEQAPDGAQKHPPTPPGVKGAQE